MWQIVSCSLRGLLVIAVRNFQAFSDRSFVSAFELIFILKLNNKGGVLKDVLGLNDVLEDTFLSPWPWPRSLKSLALASKP